MVDLSVLLPAIKEIPEKERIYHIILAGVMVGAAVAVLIWILIKNIQYNFRKNLVKKFITEYSKNDPFWNYTKMLDFSETIFKGVQHAWSKNDFKEIASHLSDDLKLEFLSTWEQMKNNNYVFHCKSVSVSWIAIIEATDNPGTDEDSFSVDISGKIIRYIWNKNTGKMLEEHGNSIMKFTDVYTFVRKDDKWLLHKIKQRNEPV